MFISREKYYRLLDYKDINTELEKEIKRLEIDLNTKERTCKVGSWCKNCAHWVTDKSEITSHMINFYTIEDCYFGFPIPKEIGGEVGYCNKNVNNLCPDFKPTKDKSVLNEEANKHD